MSGWEQPEETSAPSTITRRGCVCYWKPNAPLRSPSSSSSSCREHPSVRVTRGHCCLQNTSQRPQVKACQFWESSSFYVLLLCFRASSRNWVARNPKLAILPSLELLLSPQLCSSAAWFIFGSSTWVVVCGTYNTHKNLPRVPYNDSCYVQARRSK